MQLEHGMNEFEHAMNVAGPLSEFVLSALNHHVASCEDDCARSAIR